MFNTLSFTLINTKRKVVDKMSEFKDDVMEYIEEDIDKIKLKTGMYISYVGEKGALHLAKEVIQNSIDECANPKSPAKEIIVTLDTLSDTISVEDDGRGIPEDKLPMEILCTKLNSGSKFTREQGGASSGENGVGLTAVNALSNTFIWSSYREGRVHTLEFKDGEKVDDKTTPLKKSSKPHGCIVTFSPSQKYLGKSAKIPKKGLKEWVENISYFIPKKSKITLVIMKGLETVSTDKYKAKTISDLLKSKIADELYSPVYAFSGEMQLMEDFQGNRQIKRELSVQLSFAYSNSIEPWIDSYCNYVNTTSGGVHVNAVKDAIWRFFTRKTNETMSDKEKEKYKILKVDIEDGLNLVVNIFTTMQMQFVGQTKTEISNDDLFNPIKEIVTEQLEKYFNDNKSELTNLTKIIKSNCKARINASKIKTATVKEVVNKFDKHKMENYTPCNNDGKAYKELHICEGQSAMGSLVDGRDPDTQAFYAVRGVTANGFKRDASTILDNKEWYDYVKLIRTQIGDKCDISKLYFDKIIIETDSDVDGYNISSGIGAFHALYLQPVVKAGKLYKAIAPLYHIDDKKKPFVRDKREYSEVYQDKIIKKYDIALKTTKGKAPLKKNDYKEFIYDTQEYPDDLLRVAKHFGVNKYLIERIASYITITYGSNIDIDSILSNQKDSLKFIEHIQKKFPEIILKGNNNIRGIVDGKFQSLKLNSRFIKKIEDISNIYHTYGYLLYVTEKGAAKPKTVEMSIGEFLDMTSVLKPKIITRYKGLGEANSQQLWDTTLNPDTRILIQLTMDDVERDLKVFAKLHGQTKADLEARKSMISAYKIKREDIDN